MAKDFTQAMDNAYIIPNAIGIGNGEPTDIRCTCDTVADFKTFATNTGFDIRYDGLITYEKTNKRLMVYKGNDTWEAVGGGSDVNLEDYYTIEQVNNLIETHKHDSLYATKASEHTHSNKSILDGISNSKVSEWDAKATTNYVDTKIAEAQLGGGEVDLSGYATKDELQEYSGGKKHVYLTQAEYNALSEAEKNDETKVYGITDAEDRDATDLKLTGSKLELVNKDGVVIGTGVTLPSSGGSSVTVEDNLTSTSATNALSANQGKVLDNRITVLNAKVGDLSQLNTTIKSDIVSVINELYSLIQSNPTPPQVSVESVTLDRANLNITVGDTATLIPTVLPEGATNKNVTWSTSDSSKVSVTNGVVTAITEGNATITVTTDDGNKTASCNITVRATQVGFDILTLGFENAENPLTIPNELKVVSGKEDVVHPSVLYFENGWNGFKYWMAINPYPTTQSTYENPCMMASNNGDDWQVKGSVPIYDKPSGATHNSDCHIFMDKNGTTMHYINRAAFNSDTTSIIEYFSSTDGVTWTERKVIIERNSSFDYLSPSVCYYNNKYYMFVVDNKKTDKTLITVLESSDIDSAWTKIHDIKVPFSYTLWHLEVKLINNEFIFLIQEGSAQGGSLFLGKCKTPNDSELVLRKGSILDGVGSDWQTALYKSTFNLIDNKLDVFVGSKSGKLDSSTLWRVSRVSCERVEKTLNIGSDYLESFKDNFSDTSNWTKTNNNSTIEAKDNKLVLSGSSGIVYNNIGSYNFVYDSIIDKVESGINATSRTGVIFRFKGTTEFFGFGYIAADKAPCLYYSKSGQVTAKVRSKLSLYDGCKVSVLCLDNSIKVYIDDMLACEMVDQNFVDDGNTGRCIGYAFVSDSVVSDCSVRSLHNDMLSYAEAEKELNSYFEDYNSNPSSYALVDKFERANGNIGTSLNGVTYEVSSSSPAISSNVLKCNANQYAVVNIGQSDYEVMSKITSAFSNHWLFIRFEDLSNNIRVGYEGSAKDGILVEKVIGGTKTIITKVNLGEPCNTDFILKYKLVGNNLSVYKNNVLVTKIGLTDLDGNTKVGLGSQMANSGFDSIVVKKI